MNVFLNISCTDETKRVPSRLDRLRHQKVPPAGTTPERYDLDLKGQQSSSHPNANDDRSPLLDLMTCLFCRKTMVLEKIDPDGEGNDLIQYRCKLCNHVERVRLYRRARTVISQNL